MTPYLVFIFPQESFTSWKNSKVKQKGSEEGLTKVLPKTKIDKSLVQASGNL